MGTQVEVTDPNVAIEQALVMGDLSKLTPQQRVKYYQQVCHSLRINPLTKPFAYVTLNGKMVLYALKDATEQLRKRDYISIDRLDKEVVDDLYVCTAYASTPDGRKDSSTGAVNLKGLQGENKANAIMKAETKAKRRVTLSICGLGWLDENEIADIAEARMEVIHDTTPYPQAALTSPKETGQKETGHPSGQSPDESEAERPLEASATDSPIALDGTKRMAKNWADKLVDLDEKLGPKVTGSPKFAKLFIEKFEHREHFRNHLILHFKVDSAQDLTWEQAIALYNHLYNDRHEMPWYTHDDLVKLPPQKSGVISGWDAMKAAKELYIAKNLLPLYNEMSQHLDTRLGSLDGQRLLKVLSDILEAVGVVFTNPPSEADTKEIIDGLDKEFKRD